MKIWQKYDEINFLENYTVYINKLTFILFNIQWQSFYM